MTRAAASTWLQRRWRTLRALVQNQGGGVAVTFAIWLPVASVLLAGSFDLAAVNATRQQLQDAADAAALDAARQMGVASGSGLSARATSNVAAQINNPANVAYTVSTAINSPSTPSASTTTTMRVASGIASAAVTTMTPIAPASATPTTGISTAPATSDTGAAGVTVTISAVRQSFFLNLLPPGGWHINVSSTAVQMNTAPLCVLTSGTSPSHRFSLRNTANLTAGGCLVQSDTDLTVATTARLSAATVRSSGASTGPISPTAQTGAPVIADPFAAMTIAPSSRTCPPGPRMSKTTLTVNMTLLPGNHCGGYEVGTDFVLTLAPGEHYFLNGHLRITGAGMLQGDDVVAIFDNQSHLDADEDGVISLRGRRSGPFAGFVMVATRNNVSPFSISSTSARELLGTVYFPAATLRVSGTNTVADQSAWTVIVAESLIVDGAANLVINSNYAGSTVPVPGGVGPNGGGARLTR